MAISRFSTSSVAQGLPKYQKLWDGSSVPISPQFESIATITLSSTQGAVTFSSIPQTYKHLQIRSFAKNAYTQSPGWDWVFAQYNNDSTYTNYYSHLLYGNGTSAGAGSAQASFWTGAIAAAATRVYSANIFASSIVDIFDYTDTNKYKTSRFFGGADINTNSVYGEIDLNSSLWMNTSAITSITLYPTTANLVAGTQFALYGIKG